MQNVRISEEFKQLYDVYKKKFENQKAFRSIRHNQKIGAPGEPVFYVGVPGLGMAIAMSVIMIGTVYLLYQPFKWYLWAVYLVIVFFSFRIAMKYDKARQIRYMIWSIFDMSMNLIEQAEREETEEARHEAYQKAKDLLHKANGWVDEPAIISQIAELEKILPK
ncbi:MAG: hypothetical protein AB7E96_04720 [Deferribacterales bacterium]